MTEPIVVAQGITVRYGGVPALRNVDLILAPGEVHALLGENGAGKSTLMKALAGAVHADTGSLTVAGRPVAFASPRDALAAGIRMVHQELRLVPELTVADNIALGREPRRAFAPRAPARLHRIDRVATLQMALTALGQLGAAGAAIDPNAPVRKLSLAQRQLVEIAKALPNGFGDSDSARVLILDEPTAILSARECTALFATIQYLTAAGLGVIYTTHRLEEVERLASHVTILRDGVRVADGPAHTFTRAALVHHMVGRVVAPRAKPAATGLPRPPRPLPTPILELDHLSARGVADVSFMLHTGEILGLVGLIGAGRTEIARAIMGAARVTGGTMALGRKAHRPRSPADAVRAGVGYIPEDRAASALIALGSLRMNLTLASLRELARFRFIAAPSREREMAGAWVHRLAIRTPSIETPVARLSGGTQQKVVLARWLARDSALLVADEPTRGVDVGAREEIYIALRGAADRGAGVLVITSDLEEAFALCDRLVVMRAGRIAGELAGAERTAERVGALMLSA